MTGDVLIDRILAKAVGSGARVGVELTEILALTVKETSEFEKLLRLPFKGAPVVLSQVVTEYSEIRAVQPLYEVYWAEKTAEVAMRQERLRAIYAGIRSFARSAVGGFVLVELVFKVVDLLADLWDFVDESPIEFDRYRKAGCGGGLRWQHGLWREEDAEAVFSSLDSYRSSIETEWELILEPFFIPGVVRSFLVDMESLYMEALASFESVVRNSVIASRFKEQNPKKTRNSVHPRAVGGAA